MAFAQMAGTATHSFGLNSFDIFSAGGNTFKGYSGTANTIFELGSEDSAYTAYVYYYIFADPGA
jgi:hypothetical protein